jgi:uncharacterized protein (DUF1778 family)
MGRPKYLDKSDIRDKIITFRATNFEYELIKEYAKKHGLTVSDFLVQTAKRHIFIDDLTK